MKLITATEIDTAADMPAHSAVLYMWDWRDLRSGLSYSDIYVNDGQGGWEKHGEYVVEKVSGGKWDVFQMDAEGTVVYRLGIFPTRQKGRERAVIDLKQRLGSG